MRPRSRWPRSACASTRRRSTPSTASGNAERCRTPAGRGRLAPSAGQMLFDGHDITNEPPAHVARRGVIRSFQISAVFPHLTVLENVRVALQRKLGTSFHFWKPERSLHGLNDRALELLRAVDLERYAAIPAVELSYGRKRSLEVATTLAM